MEALADDDQEGRQEARGLRDVRERGEGGAGGAVQGVLQTDPRRRVSGRRDIFQILFQRFIIRRLFFATRASATRAPSRPGASRTSLLRTRPPPGQGPSRPSRPSRDRSRN